MSAYVTCRRCGERYSTMTRHKCPKVKNKAKDKDGLDGKLTDPDASGPGMGGGESQGDGQDQGEGQGSGEGQGEGEGEGQGEGEGSGQAEGEPEPPPAAVVVTVLKFAALTAACRDSFINISLSDKGLVVTGENGDAVAQEIIPWGEFEKRSTIDGEYYVKSVIDAVDTAVGGSGHVAEMEPVEGEAIDWSKPLEFMNGRPAQLWGDECAPVYLVGVPSGEGVFGDEHGGGYGVTVPPHSFAVYGSYHNGAANSYAIEVDEYGRFDGEQIVRNA